MDHKTSFVTNDDLKFLSSGGEMGALIRAYNWDNHPLGNPASWPNSLKNSLQLILGSAFPMFIWWSNDLYMFHNDNYIPALGEKHPDALGAPARVMWAEVWDSLWHQLGGTINTILEDGKQFYAEDLPLLLKRKGFLEETYWTFSYSPAYSDNGTIGGMFCSCYEVTKKVFSQRRLKLIKDIAETSAGTAQIDWVSEKMLEVFKENRKDLPMMLYYQIDEEGKKGNLLLQTTDIPQHLAPDQILLYPKSEETQPWPLAEVIKNGQIQILNTVDHPFYQIKCPYWGELIREIVIYPVFKSGQENTIGIFIAGVSPKLELDQDYLDFLDLLVGQIKNVFNSIDILKKEKELLQRIQEDRKKLYNLFMQAPVMVCILRGPDHVYELVNELYQKVFGRRELIGKALREALPEIDATEIPQILDRVYTTGKTFVGEEIQINISRDEGHPLEEAYFTFIYEPIRNEENEVTGIYVLCYEVTAQVLAKEYLSDYNTKLASQNKELMKVNADLDNFIYTASHDLKAPVSNLEGLFQVLLGEIGENDQIDQIKVMIDKSFDRFKNTLKDLTDISKAQKEEEDKSDLIEIQALIEEAKEGIDSKILETGAKIHTNLTVKEIRFSKKNLRSILYNLISNAVKYADPGRTPDIYISTEKKEKFTLLIVKDNGLGIPSHSVDKIFMMFKRFHDHVEGTGVGLYIVKRMMENAGGKIEVESEINKGSTFKVYFPE